MGAPVRLQKAVPGSKENAAVERREVNAHRTGRAPQGVEYLPAPFGAPLPSPLVRELSPRERGDGNARRSPRLAKTGAAELWFFYELPVLKCESGVAGPRPGAPAPPPTFLFGPNPPFALPGLYPRI